MRREGHSTSPFRRTIRRLRGPVGAVAAGSAVGQVAIAAALPLVARLYPAADVGAFALALAYCQVTAIVLTCRLEQVLPRLDPGRRWVAARLPLGSGLLLAPIVTVPVLYLANQQFSLLDGIAVALMVSSTCFMNVGTYAQLAEKRFRSVAGLRVANGLVTAVAQILGGLIAPEAWMLLLTYSLGNVAAVVVAAPSILRLRSWRDTSSSWSVIRTERLGRFALNVGLGAAFSNLGLMLPLVGVSLLFGDAAAGSFFLARRFLMVPTQLVATSISQVSYSIVARETAARTRDIVHAWMRKSRIPAIATVLMGLVFAPIISVAVGPGYLNIGWVVALLSLPSAVQMIATSFSNVMLALRMEVAQTIWHAARLVGLVVLYVTAESSNLSYLTTIVVFAAYGVLTYSSLLALTLFGLRMRNRAR